MSHEISPISTAVNVRVLTMGSKVSGFLLGFNLDDEVNVIPNRTQKSIHARSERLRVPRDSFRTLFTTTLSVTGLEDNAKSLMQLLPFSGQALLMTPACQIARVEYRARLPGLRRLLARDC